MNIQQHIHFLFLLTIIFAISYSVGIFDGIRADHEIVKRQIDPKLDNVTQCIFATTNVKDGQNISDKDMEDVNVNVNTLLDKIEDEDAKGKIKEMINGRKDKEYFTTEGDSMGLPGFSEKNLEKIPIEDDPRPPTKNFNVVEYGNDAMVQKLSDWADQGGAIHKLIKGSPGLFNNKSSGFVKSQVRYVRTLHCIQKIAYLLKKSEGTGKRVEYAIGGIWIGGKKGSPTSIKNGEKIMEAMKNVTTLKKEIGELVKGGEGDWAKMQQKRQHLADAIKEVAKSEQEEGGSSMDLMGLIYVNGKDAKEDQYFVHIAANDHYKPDWQKDSPGWPTLTYPTFTEETVWCRWCSATTPKSTKVTRIFD